MKRAFRLKLRKSGNTNDGQWTRSYVAIAPHADGAIEKARARFRKDENWRGGVLVESVEHLGVAI